MAKENFYISFYLCILIIRDILRSIFTYTYLYYFVGVLTEGKREEAYHSVQGVSDTINKDPNNLLKDDNKLKSYLAGLFEGDGHIWISKSSAKKKHNPRFCITFNIKDEPLAKKLLEIIGSGHLRYKTKENACVFIVSPVIGLNKIIGLINGELRTPALCRRVSQKVGDKLPNSGDSLKLMVPSINRKVIGGWSNQLCMVITQKMTEREIGYRGSKSVTGKYIPINHNKPVL
jgi:hypothetical protein